jgi:hypothetical protein
LVYTWDRKKIRHRYFSGAWLEQAFSKMQAEAQAQIQKQEQDKSSSRQEAQ